MSRKASAGEAQTVLSQGARKRRRIGAAPRSATAVSSSRRLADAAQGIVSQAHNAQCYTLVPANGRNSQPNS